MSPEQATDPEHIDFRADIYSLGATLYHAAAGHPPLERATVMETIQAQIDEMPVPVHEKEPAFNRELSLVLQRMLAKRREDRFESWEEVKVALAAAQSAESVSAVRLSSMLPAVAEPSQPLLSSPPSHARETLPLPQRESPPLADREPFVGEHEAPLLEREVPPLAGPREAPVPGALLGPMPGQAPEAARVQTADRIRQRIRQALAHPDATRYGVLLGAGLLVLLVLLMLLLPAL
jgi:serine/threonine protein kinase